MSIQHFSQEDDDVAYAKCILVDDICETTMPKSNIAAAEIGKIDNTLVR